MTEIFFPEFEFRKYTERPTEIEFVLIPIDEKAELPLEQNSQDIKTRESVDIDRLFTFSNVKVTRILPTPWNPRTVKQEFLQQLSAMNRAIGRPNLSMRKKTFRFVSQNQMRPETEEDKQWLIDRYGESLSSGGAGDCTPYENGTYLLRIGTANQQRSRSKVEVLGFMSHEYGHSLSPFIDSAVFEEMKAYAFSTLFFRYYFKNPYYSQPYKPGPDTHQTSQYWLEQLAARHVPLEATLAHLNRRHFGEYKPDSYRAFL